MRFCSTIDRSENGEIVVKEQVQSEYWHIKYYSLLISISRFLVTSRWNGREKPLETNAEVTVQLDSVPPGTMTYTKGSFFAVVKDGSNKEWGEGTEYTLVLEDKTELTLPRRRLRERVWHGVAFLGITNEKQHVAITTQAFHARQLEFWRQWHSNGREAALSYARNDRASLPYASPSAGNMQTGDGGVDANAGSVGAASSYLERGNATSAINVDDLARPMQVSFPSHSDDADEVVLICGLDGTIQLKAHKRCAIFVLLGC